MVIDMKWTKKEEQLLKTEYMSENITNILKRIKRTPDAIRRKASRLGIAKNINFVGAITRSKKILNEPFHIYNNKNALGHFISGLVAGEGSFINVIKNNSKSQRFMFSVEMAQDEEVISLLKEFFMCGNLYHIKRKNKNWKDTMRFTVSSFLDIHKYIIPFFDTYNLRNTHKRKQYLVWRQSFYNHLNKMSLL